MPETISSPTRPNSEDDEVIEIEDLVDGELSGNNGFRHLILCAGGIEHNA